MSKRNIHSTWLDDFPDFSNHLKEKPKRSKPIISIYEKKALTDGASIRRNSNLGPLELGHHLYEDRENRLDLISNKLLDIRLSVNDIDYSLCDISKSGFSYARKISTKPGLDFMKTKKLIELSTQAVMGKRINARFWIKRKNESEHLDISCTLINHRLMYGLTFEDLKREFTKFLYFKSVRRNNDKDFLFDKMDYLDKLTWQAIKKSCWNDALAISLNTTFANMMKQAGATSDTIDSMYTGYKDKPSFIKFGVSLTDQREKEKLHSFIQAVTGTGKMPKESVRQVFEKEFEDITEIATTLMSKFTQAERSQNHAKEQTNNARLTYGKLLLKCWEQCLVQLKLDQEKSIPKSNNQTLADLMKTEAQLYNNNPEKFIELSQQQNSISLEGFLVEGLSKIVKGNNSKQNLLRTVVRKSIRYTLKCYEKKIIN